MSSVRKTTLLAITVLMACAALGVFFAHSSFSYAKEYNVDFDPAYGYGSLSQNMQRLYDDMVNDIETMLSVGTDINSPTSKYGAIEYKPLEAMTYKCSDYGLSYPETCSVFSALRLLHPEYYFLPGIILNVNNGEYMKLTIISEYATAGARDDADELIERAKSDILTDVDELPSDYDKVLALHDRIINDIEYALDNVGAPESAHWAHSIIGAASNKKAGVCETYAKWFSYLLLESDIENYIVTGTGRGQSHAWNIVKLDDGKWYYFDLTWDDTIADETTGIYYGYFAAPASVIAEEHTRTPDGKYGIDFLYKIPAAEDTYKYSYYNVIGAMPDCSNENAFYKTYTALWKKALEKGDRVIQIYTANETDLQFVLSMYYELNTVRSKLHEAGINDNISINGGATVYNEKLICVYITASSFCPNALKHSYTAKLAAEEYLKSAADCKNNAVYYYACEFCGKKGTGTYEYGQPTNDHRLSHTPEVKPDCEKGGNAEYWFCSVCGKYFADSSAVNELTYDELEIEAYGHTYTNAASTGEKEHKLTCERCGKAIKEAHSWDNGRVISEPSASGSGKTLYTCTVCGMARTETVTYDGHVHSYPETWSFDNINHWRECACGDKTALSEHSFAITADNDKTATYTCSVCGFNKTVEKDKPHVHEFGKWQPYDKETHKRVCIDGDGEEIAPHVWTITGEDSDGDIRTITYTCTSCGETKTVSENDPITSHTHVYSEWEPCDKETHKRVCVDGDGEEIAPHVWAITGEDSDGKIRTITYTCTSCGATKTVSENDPIASHTHVYGDWQPFDAKTHKRVCTYGDDEESAPHDFIVSSVSTEGLVRNITYVCPICGETYTEAEELTDNTAERAKLIAIFAVSTLITAGAVTSAVIFIKRKKLR